MGGRCCMQTHPAAVALMISSYDKAWVCMLEFVLWANSSMVHEIVYEAVPMLGNVVVVCA